MRSGNLRCQTGVIVAYIEGDLDQFEQAKLEDHLRECEQCSSELQTQRLLLAELDTFLASAPPLPVPRNFARVVAANAESDMSGARASTERKRALRFCLVLVLAAFALLGATTRSSVLDNIRLVGSQILGVLGLLWMALRDAALGLIVILRVLTQGLLPDSYLVALTGFLFLAFALILLSLLISSYHRYRRMRLLE